MIAIGVRLAVVEPRIPAAVLFAGSLVPRTAFAETLHADLGGLPGVPRFAGDAAARFFTRHLS